MNIVKETSLLDARVGLLQLHRYLIGVISSNWIETGVLRHPEIEVHCSEKT